LATARNVGMVLGIGFAGAIFTTVQAQSQANDASAALFAGVQAGWLGATAVALLGALTSSVRGRSQNNHDRWNDNN
jgi:hypothetical protein